MKKNKLWNWQRKDWPNFRYDAFGFQNIENKFLHQSGILIGAYKHISDEDKATLTVDLMSDEAVKTSEIEGEYLDHASVQSSICRNFGLDAGNIRVPPAERGIAEMMVDLYNNYDEPLSHDMVGKWHGMLMQGSNARIEDIGCYRSTESPMQIVSGYPHSRKVHFEAPPAERLDAEMNVFIDWFNCSSPEGEKPLLPLARASIAHLHFASIHPFEDGNGRVSRALSEKALSQGLGNPTLIALSQTIQSDKKSYYKALADNSEELDVSGWVDYFSKTVIDAQNNTLELVEFLIDKAKFYEKHADHLNERQQKVVSRMFKEGVKGFQGGLSADNYITITQTSASTATRDLQDLTQKGALTRTGEHKSTRYWLNIKER